MKSNTGLITGTAIIVLVVAYYGYLIIGVTTGGTAVPSQTTEVVTLDEAALTDIRNKSLNGNLPITIKAGDLDNPAPFLSR